MASAALPVIMQPYHHPMNHLAMHGMPVQARDYEYDGIISASTHQPQHSSHSYCSYSSGGSTGSTSTCTSDESGSTNDPSTAAERANHNDGYRSVAPSTSSTKTPSGMSVYKFDDSVFCAVSELGQTVASTNRAPQDQDSDDDEEEDEYLYDGAQEDDGTECAISNVDVSYYEGKPTDDTTVSTMTTTTRAAPRPILRVRVQDHRDDDYTAVSSISGAMTQLGMAPQAMPPPLKASVTTTPTAATTTFQKQAAEQSVFSRVSSGNTTVPGEASTAASTSTYSSTSASTPHKSKTYLQTILEMGDDAVPSPTSNRDAKRKKDKTYSSSGNSVSTSASANSLAPRKKKGLLRMLFSGTTAAAATQAQ